MKTSVALCLAAIGSSAAFVANPTSSRSSTELFGGAQGYATSLDGKKEKVAGIQQLLADSQMVFTIPASSMTVKQSEQLRRSLPEGTSISVVKNTLMAKAVEGTDYAVATSMLKGANMWVFIEEDIGATIKSYNAFIKDAKLQETHTILGGIMDQTVYDEKGVQAIGKLPSKLELISKIAGAIKAVPTKVARVIKAPNSKLARAIKLATDENTKE
jgi:large subunit ribosomal protein L10